MIIFGSGDGSVVILIVLRPFFMALLLIWFLLCCREGSNTMDATDAAPQQRNGKSHPPLVTQQSTVWTRRQNAVSVRHAHKHYGPSKNPNHVLSNLNMTVAKGTM